MAAFQAAIGARVFKREGRRLALTECGWRVFNYADEIFSIGAELNDWLRGGKDPRSRNLMIGVSSTVDMQAMTRLLAPALDGAAPPRLSCVVGDTEGLLADLRLRTCDLVLAPAPAPAGDDACFSHLIASLEVSLFAPAPTAKKYRADFPQSIQRAPLVLRGETLRQSVETWLSAHGLEPDIKAEIAASELSKSIAAECGALVFAPSSTRQAMRERYGFEEIGVLEGAEERIYAVTNQRKIRNPFLARIVATTSLTTSAEAMRREAPSEADSESDVCA